VASKARRDKVQYAMQAHHGATVLPPVFDVVVGAPREQAGDGSPLGAVYFLGLQQVGGARWTVASSEGLMNCRSS
jgi:hypothetical protein